MVVVNVYRKGDLVKAIKLDRVLLKLDGNITNISDQAKGISNARLTDSGKDDIRGYYGTFTDSKGHSLTFETREKPSLSFSDLFLLPKLKSDYLTTLTIQRA